MKKALLLLCLVSSLLPAVSVQNLKVLNVGHSDALIGWNATGSFGDLRIRWTTGSTNCSTGIGGRVVGMFWTRTYGNNYRQDVITNLPASTFIHVCPEINSTPGGTDWSTGAQIDFTTQSLPPVHPAPPVPSQAAIPSIPDFSGACVWVVGTGSIQTCMGESTPNCSTFMECWNAAMDQQLAHKTIIQIPAGSITVHRNFIHTGHVAKDTYQFNTSSFTRNGVNNGPITLNEGDGITFGRGYGGLPGNGSYSGENTCDALRQGEVYYAHFTSGSSGNSFQIYCNYPYSKGGTLANFSNTGWGTSLIAKYPRVLNWIMVTSTAPSSQMPPSGVRTNPIYAPVMAKLVADSNPSPIFQDEGNLGIGVLPLVITFHFWDNDANDAMPANQWFTGLEFSAPAHGADGNPWDSSKNVATAPDPVNGNFPFGTRGANSAIIVLPNGDSQDIVFDRNWIHGLGWPDRLNNGIIAEGHNIAFINNYIENFSYGRKMIDDCSGTLTDDTYHFSDSPNFIRTSDGPGPFIFANNYLESTGIGYHFDGGAQWNWTADVLIQRNYFKSLRKYMRTAGAGQGSTVVDPLWSGQAYAFRQPLEFKGAHRVKIDGNIFDTDARHTSIGTITMTSVTYQGIYDVDITNNTLLHVYAGVVAMQTGQNQMLNHPFDRVRVQNNLFTDLNGDFWISHTDGVSPGCAANGTFGGYMLKGFNQGEDYIIDHNTVTDSRGGQPGFLNTYSTWEGAEGMTVTNNFLDVTNENGWTGLVDDGQIFQNGTGQQACVKSMFSKTQDFLSCMFPTAVMKNNVIRATTGNIQYITNNWYTAGNFSNLFPASANGDVGWLSLGSADLHLKSSSPYISGNNGGNEVGADMDKLDVAQGNVKNLSVSGVTGTAATVSFVAPDTQGCPVDISSSDPTVATNIARFNNSGGGRIQSVGLSGLTSERIYYFRVQCAAQQLTGAFRTK